MRRRRDLVAEPAPESGLTVAQECAVLRRLLFASEPSSLAEDYHAACCAVTGSTAEEFLERTWRVVDAFGLRDAAERNVERQAALVGKWNRRDVRHDERSRS